MPKISIADIKIIGWVTSDTGRNFYSVKLVDGVCFVQRKKKGFLRKRENEDGKLFYKIVCQKIASRETK